MWYVSPPSLCVFLLIPYFFFHGTRWADLLYHTPLHSVLCYPRPKAAQPKTRDLELAAIKPSTWNEPFFPGNWSSQRFSHSDGKLIQCLIKISYTENIKTFALRWLFKQQSKTKLQLAWLNLFEQAWDATAQYKQHGSAGFSEHSSLAVIDWRCCPEYFCETWVLNETKRHSFRNVPCLTVWYSPGGHKAGI